MKYYTIYDPSSYEVVMSGYCSDEDFQFQTLPNCQTIEGQSNHQSNYVVNGQIQTYTNDQKVLKAQRQPSYMKWSNETFNWVDTRTDNQKRQNQIDIVNSQRNLLLTASDWIVVRATDQGAAIPADWKTYRQALRDISTQTGYPFNVVWPIPPTTN